MTKQNSVVIFAHGYNASSQKDWFHYVSSGLKNLGIDSYIHDMPGGKFPRATVWIEIVKMHHLF